MELIDNLLSDLTKLSDGGDSNVVICIRSASGKGNVSCDILYTWFSGGYGIFTSLYDTLEKMSIRGEEDESSDIVESSRDTVPLLPVEHLKDKNHASTNEKSTMPLDLFKYTELELLQTAKLMHLCRIHLSAVYASTLKGTKS